MLQVIINKVANGYIVRFLDEDEVSAVFIAGNLDAVKTHLLKQIKVTFGGTNTAPAE